VSIAQQIETLERLVRIDSQIRELSESVAGKKGEISGVRTEMSQLEERLGTDRGSVTEMDRTRGELVQEVRQISGQIDRSRERLGRARNEREVQAAERELDELRKIQRDREEEIRKLSELADQARQSIADSERRQDELSEQLAGSLEGTTQSIDELRARLEGLSGERKQVAASLPSLVFRRYERLASRGRVPVAKTHDGTCLGCFVKLPPMMFHTMLGRTQFEECPNCHRIIYYEPPPHAQPEETDEPDADDEHDPLDAAAGDEAQPATEG
jgi:uncharacterized protein